MRSFYNPMDIGKETIALVRAYNLQNADGNDVVHYEVWDQQEVVFVNGETMEEEPVIVGGREVTRIPNEFGEIPFIEFANNERKASDLLKYKGLVDAYDKVVSGFINDLDDIQEIVLVLKDLTGESEDSLWVPVRDAEGNEKLDADGDPLLEEVKKTGESVAANQGAEISYSGRHRRGR